MEEKKIADNQQKSPQSDQWGFIKWVVKSLLAVIVVLIALLFISNMAWLYVFQSYDYSSYKMSTSEGNNNYLRGEGEIVNGNDANSGKG